MTEEQQHNLWRRSRRLIANPLASLAIGAAGGLLAAVFLTGLSTGESPWPPSGEVRNAEIVRLEAYANGLPDRYPQSRPPASPEVDAQLPDVATMMARLEARLATNGEDADGWRLLGISRQYLGDTRGAAEALKHALSLRPGDSELIAAIAQLGEAAPAVDGKPN